MKVETLYKQRFNRNELHRKNAIWKILCKNFFQKYISKDSSVLDIGAGYCEFINNIQCSTKYAVDLNKDSAVFASSDVKFFVSPSTDLSCIEDNSINIVFMSNFLEHLKTKEEIIQTLRESFRVLNGEGKIMILQPNIRYLYKEYWDFFDHYTPLSDKSLSEALEMAGFRIEEILPKFLPYTTKSKIPQHPFLVKMYLKFPLLWQILGKQTFVIGRKDV